MKFVPMDLSHVHAVAHLEKICFHDPWSLNAITSEVSNPLSVWIVALEGERVIGYVGSQSVIDQADMMNIAVDPDYRRHGIAELLVRGLEAQLKDRGVRELLLEVRVSNEPAQKLYEKLAFTVVGRRPGYYSRPKEDALIMRKELDT